jgi:L-lysine 2,3-aminomutase
VLIHELIHYYDLDCDTTDWIDNILPIKTQCNSLLLNEAITEAMAIILHTHYYSEITNSAQDFKLLLRKEITYSKEMHDKILNHNNVKTLNDLFNVCHNTNVIPYYIIKYVLIEDIEEALKFLFNKNKIKKYIIKKLTSYFNNNLNYDIKQLNYEISAKMSCLNLF